MPKPKEPGFLNVDLDIESASSLDTIAAELGARVHVLHSGPGSTPRRHFLSLEISSFGKGPDATIHALCDAVETLSPAAKRVWKRARKEFDVGYELITGESRIRFVLRQGTIERAARLGATLAVTTYRREKED